MQQRFHWGWFTIPIFSFLFILAACGPAQAVIDPLPSSTPTEAVALPAPTATLPAPVEPESAEKAIDEPDSTAAAASLDRSLGDPNAPVVIVEYSDFQCPFCRRHHQQTLPPLVEEYINSGRLRYEFRDFPIASLHPLAYRLHEAARCATDVTGNDGFWQAHDLFFDQIERFQIESLEALDAEIATAFGELDMSDVSDCLLSNRHTDAVQADYRAGEAAGVTGTPAFFIEGFQISGAQPFDAFAQAIEAAENGTLAELMQPPPSAPNAAPTPAAVTILPETALGDPDAPVKIVEFSDYQCPFCRRHALQTMSQMKPLIESGDVYYVFRDFPIASLHPLAYKLHEAALCVQQSAGTDAFWLVHDLFFAQAESFQQNSEAAMGDAIAGRLSAIDLWSSEIESCYASGNMASEVEAGIAEADQLRLNGTPSFFINGFPLVGAQPFETFEYAINLAKEGTLAEAYQPREQPAAPPPQGNGEPVDVPLAGNEPAKGAADAPITIIEYSSYQCPFCKRHVDQTMPQIQPLIDNGTVRYIFKDYPLPSQPQAFKVHESVHCMHEQGDDALYWETHDVMFANQSRWSGTAMGAHVDVIKQLAYTIEGVDAAAFDECLDNDRYAEQVQANFDEGARLNVRGTPSFFVNGLFISGAQPFEVFDGMIQQALQGR